ncbi:MAG: hypothetical protein ABMA64_24750 [Myxococcota bacterium]
MWWLAIGCASIPDWFHRSTLDTPPCGGGVAQVPGSATVWVHVSRDADPDSALAATQAAASWWAGAGLDLSAAGTDRITLPEVLGGDVTRGDGIERVLDPLAGWFAAPHPHGDVDLVLVRDIAGPRSPVSRDIGDLVAGFTVSPALAEDPLSAAILARLGPRPHPTIFVSTDALSALGPDRARWVVAHELGHALGLPHDPEPGNLMFAEPSACRPSLRPDQASAIVAARDVDTPP